MPSNILKFSKDRLITAANIVDGMLFFTDGNSEPKKINIKKFRGDTDDPVDHTSGTTRIYDRPFEERDITVIKDHPINAMGTSVIKEYEETGSSLDSDGVSTVVNIPGVGDVEVELPEDQTDPATVTSSVSVTTLEPDAYNSELLTMKGKFSNAATPTEIYFYYTFNKDKADPENTPSGEALISNLSDSDVYRVQAFSQGTGGILGVSIQSTESGLDTYSSALAGITTWPATVYYVFAVKEHGSDRLIPGGLIRAELKEKDNSSGVVSDFTVEASIGNFIGSTESFQLIGRYSDDGGSQVLRKGFFVSKAYFGDDHTKPTLQEVRDQALAAPSNDRFPNQFHSNADDNFFVTAQNTFTKQGYLNAEHGATYYVVAYMQTNNTTQGIDGIVFSNNSFSDESPALNESVITSIKTRKMIPRVMNRPANVFTTDKSGDIRGKAVAGGTGTITEAGFLFSKTISNVHDLINAFDAGKNADGTPVTTGYTETFKVGVGLTNTSDNGHTVNFSLNTKDKLGALEYGETVYYVAYAKNSYGEIKYGSNDEYGIDAPQVEQFTLPTPATTPVIRLNEGTSIYKFSNAGIGAHTGGIKYSVTAVVESMPNGDEADEVGIVYTIPSNNGQKIEITESTRIGFGASQTDVSLIDSSYYVTTNKTVVNKNNSAITFSANNNHGTIGTYTMVDHEFPPLTQTDVEAWGLDKIGGFHPFGMAVEAYAYVIWNGKKYVSNVLHGALANITTGINLTSNEDCPFSPFSHNFLGAPTLQNVGDFKKNNVNHTYHQWPKEDVRESSVTVYSRIGDDGRSTAIIDTGFYWSTTNPNTYKSGNTLSAEEIKDWVADATKFGQADGENVGRNVALNTFRSDGKFDGEWHTISQSINWSTIGQDHFWFTGYVKGKTVPGQGYLQALTGINDARYCTPKFVKRAPVKSSIASADEPTVVIDEVTLPEYAGENGGASDTQANVTLKGRAKQQATYYSITKRGFKFTAADNISSPSSSTVKTYFETASNASNIKSIEGENMTSEVYAQTHNFNINPGNYIVVAWCQTNVNGTINNWYSNNYEEIDISNKVVRVVEESLSLEVTSLNAGWPPLLKGKYAGVATRELGFLIIGKEEETWSITGSDYIKGIHEGTTATPSGVILGKKFASHEPTFKNPFEQYTSSSINNPGQTVDPPRKGWKYYYCAYSYNKAGELVVSGNYDDFFFPAEIPQIIEVSTRSLWWDHLGKAKITEEVDDITNDPGGATDHHLFINTTPQQGSWYIGNGVSNKWSSGARIRAKKVYFNGLHYLAIESPGVNYKATQVITGQVEVVHSQSKQKIIINLYQKGVPTQSPPASTTTNNVEIGADIDNGPGAPGTNAPPQVIIDQI